MGTFDLGHSTMIFPPQNSSHDAERERQLMRTPGKGWTLQPQALERNSRGSKDFFFTDKVGSR